MLKLGRRLRVWIPFIADGRVMSIFKITCKAMLPLPVSVSNSMLLIVTQICLSSLCESRPRGHCIMRDGGFLVTVLILNIVLSGFAPFSPRLYHPRILQLHYHTSHGLIIKIITIIGKTTKDDE